MDRIRYIAFGDDFVLIEKTLNSGKAGKIRNPNIQLYGEDEYTFDKLFAIFIFNKDYSWLYFNPKEQKKNAPIFDSSVDKIYLFAKLPRKFPIKNFGEKIDIASCSTLDPLFRAIYVAAYALVGQNNHTLGTNLIKEVGDIAIQKKMQYAFTPHEKEILFEKISNAVQNPADSMFVEERNQNWNYSDESSLLDLVYNLMEDLNTCFYPFHSIKPNPAGFTPDQMFPVYFHQLDWNPNELSLSVGLKVPGSFVLDKNEHHLPAKIDTFSYMEIDFIKHGVPCFKKVMINTGETTGYIDLTSYPMLTSFQPPLKIKEICDNLHTRNLAALQYKILLYLKIKSGIPNKTCFIEKHTRLFENLTPKQENYLKKFRITKTNGFFQPTNPEETQPSFNVYEEELENLLVRFNMILSACKEGKKFEDLNLDMFTYKLFNDLINDVFNTIYDDNYFKNLNQAIEGAKKEYLTYDFYIQRLRFFLTFLAPKLPEMDNCNLFSFAHNSFNFIFEFDGKYSLGCAHA